MENRNNRTMTITIVTGLVALLLGLCGGATIGGLAGFALGRQAGERATSRIQPLGPREFGVPGQATPVRPRATGNGVLVGNVVAGSPAAEAGLQAGDIILAVNDVVLDQNTTLAEELARFRPGDTVNLRIDHFGVERMVSVRLGAYPGAQDRAYLGVRYSDSGPGTPAP